jgi:hypothetical protein
VRTLDASDLESYTALIRYHRRRVADDRYKGDMVMHRAMECRGAVLFLAEALLAFREQSVTMPELAEPMTRALHAFDAVYDAWVSPDVVLRLEEALAALEAVVECSAPTVGGRLIHAYLSAATTIRPTPLALSHGGPPQTRPEAKER